MRVDGTCKSCGAPLRWAVTAATGSRIPLDALPVETGNLGVVSWVEQPGAFSTPVVAVNPSPGCSATPYRYTSHFATCPQADQHRRRT